MKRNETLRPLLKVAVPVMLANGAETIYNLTDSWFLGRLGSREISAPTIAFNLIMLIILGGLGISAAGTTLISRAVGQKDQKKAEFFLGQVCSLLLLASLLLAAAGWLLAGPFLRAIQTPPDLFELTADYIRIICLGIPFMYGFFALQSAMEGTGNTMAALRIQLLATAVNIPLDAVLIFGAGSIPSLGVKGAALATVLSRGVAAVSAYVILFRGRQGIRLHVANLPFKPSVLRLLLKVAIPSSLSHMASSLGFIVLQGLVNSFGTAVIAAFGIVNRIHSLFYMPAQGMARGTASLVGQSLGAGDPSRAGKVVKTGVFLALIYIIPGMIFCFFYGSQFIRFFINDPAVIDEGSLLFRIISPSVIVFTVFLILAGAFQGAGDTRSLMMMHLGRLWVFRLPFAWLLAFPLGWGTQGIWYAMVFSNVVITAIGIFRFRSEGWVHALKEV
ncbi:MATE family efflux transporter [Oceanispirochaeta sp.]|uniref:MATE family efflux transporter n=1 Tax=Oceanispirochaeta sp. TaxID=2035350 RepID=UPI00260EAC71|nr:MATE family efflux transporter [Oceanispirochaeta sp.]MDA3956326.1 MATE family efflux transporter [Oceanispirochaeta sp.]